MSRRRVMMMLIIGAFSDSTKAFIKRVKNDGGVIESPKCIDEKLKL